MAERIEVQIARVEEKLDALTALISKSNDNQEEKNQIFFDVRDKVNILEATARGAWKTLAVLGTVSAFLGAAFGWIIEHPPSFAQKPAILSHPSE